MGTGCTKEPRVNETNKRNNKLLMNLKTSLKLKITQVETQIKEKNREIEKYKDSAKTYLRNGNKFEAKRQLKKKKFNEEIVKKLNAQIQILDDQQMILESTEINQDITETVKKVNEKIKQVSNNVDIRELEKVVEEMNEQKEKQKEFNEEINEALNQANEQDEDLSDELEQLEAEMNNNIPKAGTEKIEDNNIQQVQPQTHKEPEGNLVFL